MKTSLFSGFYRRSLEQRLEALLAAGMINEKDYHCLKSRESELGTDQADCLIENVIGVFGLPVGLALNFLINRRDYLIPMAVEEPSVVAAASAAAKAARQSGGFTCEIQESLLIGQIQLLNVENFVQATSVIRQNTARLLRAANEVHPRMNARGGGVREIEVKWYERQGEVQPMLVVELLMDTCDAMGANLINSVCEAVAPLLEELTGTTALLRILSNLADRSLVTASVTYPLDSLRRDGYSPERIRDGIIAASHLAEHDPYRAATHNKGIMNGIDAVALATGNDWRAIEAGAHAFAARSGKYSPLSLWRSDGQGALVGTLELPLKVGTVGAQVHALPMVPIMHRLLGLESARELAEVMAAVGLAQNFAALRALATHGINHGHLRLHARSVALAAGAPQHQIESVVEELLASGPIKVWRARDILASYAEITASLRRMGT